jgi:GNAT superfamily N-acetyltransferase
MNTDQLLQVVSPSENELETALQLAFRHLPPEESMARVGTLLQQYDAGQLDLNGLFLAKNGDAFVAAMYAQRREDGSVFLWVPSTPAGYSPELLYNALENYCRNEKTFAAVALADKNQPFDEKMLLEYGHFEFLSDLVYMAVELPPQEAAFEPKQLRFVPIAENGNTESEHLQTLVKATYNDSLDFPKLMSITPVEKVLLGYKAGALFVPELWFFVQYQEQDIGVLLLTDASSQQCELTYTGLLSEYRGRGFSKEIVRFAKSVAAQRGKMLLLTSVDEKNIPACQSYLANGFRAWDRKKVFARFYD